MGGKGCTVIDYILGDREIRESIIEMRVADRIDSDHHPVEVRIKGEKSRKREKRGDKKKYKLLCESKKKEMNDRWEREAENVRREGEVWEIINRDRRRKKRFNEGIEMEEWKEHF
ncbi:hypothetical protein X777_14457 [Ooceraea biroi]|uniref:Endonuclease/exonuclease/phosphatase domain-containing protein n=1 Tax=Ooceraea biroi TaxID=2015173 RepID=A0A026VWX2_OOCBI|nr:hypothetical protein X777_14457 [Ooceraea biroi]